MAFGNKSFTPITLLEKANGSITSSYTSIGTTTAFCRIVNVVNNTDKTMYFSTDGTHDHFKVASLQTRPLNLTAASANGNNGFSANGTTWYVKYASAPSSGEVVIEGITG